ncbi:class I SAM-dependent methyltransferase [Candidatus Falkowbacteria bacterium]|nr:class I SAM-dependent methyltransferase [Candidatus Falkowbacteria bacterium]
MNNQLSKCIVCGSGQNGKVFEEFGVSVFKCECGHLFSDAGSRDDYDGYFGNENVDDFDVFWWRESHHLMYQKFISQYMQGRSGKILDVGCGLGFFLQAVQGVPGWEAYGYEISEPAANYASNILRLKHVFKGRVEDNGFENGSFEIVTLFDVIEHLPNPKPMLDSIKSLLAEDGIIFVHTPNAGMQLLKARLKRLIHRGVRPKGHYLEASDHVNIYTPGSLSRLLLGAGFAKVEFVHLPPIQSVAGSRTPAMKLIKNLYYYFAVFLFKASFGRVNIDNLFAVATVKRS